MPIKAKSRMTLTARLAHFYRARRQRHAERQALAHVAAGCGNHWLDDVAMTRGEAEYLLHHRR